MPRSFLLKRGRDEPSTPLDCFKENDRQQSKILRISIEGQNSRLAKEGNLHNTIMRNLKRSSDALSLSQSSKDNLDDQLESKLDVLIRAAQQIMKRESNGLAVDVDELDPTKVKSKRPRRQTVDAEEDSDEIQDDDTSSETSCDNDAKTKYECNQCGRQFKTRYTLTIHQRMPDHTKSRPFVCNVCGKGFRLSSTLCRHKIIHTEEKPHKCKTCNKAFNRSSTLKTHLKTHSPVKEFNCEVCGKGFHQKGNLRNHALIHTGEKPYKCDLCDRAFNKLSNLKFHLQTHDQSKSFAYHCSICDCPFEKKFNLKEHMQLAH